MAKTMLGMTSPARPTGSPQATPQPQAPAHEVSRRPLAGTMIGMPSPIKPASLHAAPPGAAPPASRQPEPQGPSGSAQAGSTGGSAGLGKTMLGFGAATPAAPVARPVQAAAAAPPPVGPPAGAQPVSDKALADTVGKPRFGATIMGVARPGIAPLQPGSAPAPPRASAPYSAPGQPPAPSGPLPVSRIPSSAPLPHAPRTGQGPFPTSRPAWMNGLLIGAGMLVAAGIGGGVALLGPKPAKLTVKEFSIDESGHDHLTVTCEGCQEGATLHLGSPSGKSASGKIVRGSAELSPAKPLALGRNELEFTLTDLDGELKKTKPVILPISFRVITNWDGRHALPPYGEVAVSAPSGSSVEIDGKSVPLKEQRATYRINYAEQSTGESKQSVPVAFDVPVRVTVEGKAKQTSASLKNSIAPLTLVSPAPVHQLRGGPLTVAGQTTPGATVTAGEKKTTADSQGKFTITFNAPVPGDVWVTAFTDKSLARRVKRSFVTVAPVPKGVKGTFRDIHAGDEVLVQGNVIESRIQAGTTSALLEVAAGCDAPPCLLRATYGEPYVLHPNRAVRVSGVVVAGDPLTLQIRRIH